MCGGAVLRGSIDAIDVWLVYIFYTHTIFLDQAKGRFKGVLLCVHIFELIFCFCAFDAFNLYHLVRLMRHQPDTVSLPIKHQKKKGGGPPQIMPGSGSQVHFLIRSSHARTSLTCASRPEAVHAIPRAHC